MLKRNITSILSILIAGLGLLILPETTYAQSYVDTSKGAGDCGSEEIGRPPGFKNSQPIQPKPPKSKQRIKAATEAAEKAISAGYNYILISPLKRTVESDKKDFVERSGFGNSQWEKVTHSTNYRTVTRQKCRVIDDITAFHLIWDETLPQHILRDDTEYEIMDAREFLRSIDSPSALITQPRTPKISRKQYKSIGDKERFAAQHPVMAAARECRGNLGPTSLDVFKRDPQLRNRAAENQCLEAHRTSAEAVVWADFPLTISDRKNTLATKGYTLNRPRTADPASVIRGQTVDSNVWGDGWTDLSSNLNAPSGAFLYHRGLRAYLFASNILDETAIIDHAVFLTSGNNMDNRKSGIALKDETDEYQKKFESAKRSILSKQRKAEEKIERERSGNVRSYDRKIEYKQRDITRLQDRINEMRQQDDEAMIAQTKASMSAFPDAKFDENAMRKQLKAVRETNIQAQERKLAKLRNELSALQNQAPEASTSSPTAISKSEQKPSQTVTNSNRLKGLYHAFETYQNVLIIGTSTLGSTSSCLDSYLLCADKLQAYNAIGPRLGKAGFTPLAAPTGYKPYENR